MPLYSHSDVNTPAKVTLYDGNGNLWSSTNPLPVGTFDGVAGNPISAEDVGGSTYALWQFIKNATIEKTSGAAAGNLNIQTGGKFQDGTPAAVDDDDNAVFLTDKYGRNVQTKRAPTATLSNVSGSATSVTLISANNHRLGFSIYNDSTADLYVKYGATASTSSFTVLMVAGAYYEDPYGYTGIVDGIWASATGNARCTEMT